MKEFYHEVPKNHSRDRRYHYHARRFVLWGNDVAGAGARGTYTSTALNAAEKSPIFKLELAVDVEKQLKLTKEEDMASANSEYDSKLQELARKVDELVKHSAALRELIQPGLDPQAFHGIYQPFMTAAKDIHEIFHALQQTVGGGHGEGGKHNPGG